jgi:hypothetical protein
MMPAPQLEILYRVLHNSLQLSYSGIFVWVYTFIVAQCDPFTFVSSVNMSRKDPQQALL